MTHTASVFIFRCCRQGRGLGGKVYQCPLRRSQFLGLEQAYFSPIQGTLLTSSIYIYIYIFKFLEVKPKCSEKSE